MGKSSRSSVKSLLSRELSAADRQLFREAVGSVDPIDVSPRRPPDIAASPQPPPPRSASDAWADEIEGLPVLAAGDVVSYAAAGIQQRVLRRLRAGTYGVDGVLDLHGSTVEQAGLLLWAALRDKPAEACRCLLVVHGKGYRSEGNRPVLKNRVNAWLRQHPAVLAFCSAKPADGGVGAVYVLLRPPR